MADTVLAGDHVCRRQHHAERERDGEDDRLPGVEHRQRGVGLDRGLLVGREALVIARGLALLGAEVLHGLEVEQRVDRLGVGIGVAVIHLAADGHAPHGRLHREPEVDHDHSQHDNHIAPVELDRENRNHKAELDDRGDERHQRHPRHLFDAVAAALKHARQPAGLLLEMKAQRELVHVRESAERELAHGMHRHLREQAFAQLGEYHHQDAHEAIEHGREQRRADEPGGRA